MKEEVFSAREKLVIQRVKEGRTNKEIAQELNVAEITIKKQLSLLYHRFQVKNRTQLLHAVSGENVKKGGIRPPFFKTCTIPPHSLHGSWHRCPL